MKNLLPMAIGFCGLLISFNAALAQSWQLTSAPSNSWTAIVSSADGTKLAAAADGGGIYFSTNSGVSWALSDVPPNSSWVGMAASADGNNLLAAPFVGAAGIYTSTNAGVNWTLNNLLVFVQWTSVASSSDGAKLLLCGTSVSGSVFTSIDGGTTWRSNNVPNNFYTSATSSADGNKLAMIRGSFYVTSTNAGGDWVVHASPSGLNVECSADGSRLVLLDGSHHIYSSINFGTTWVTNNMPAPSGAVFALSADGIKLTALKAGWSYTSTNAGASWTSNAVPNLVWSSIASSADGNKLAAVVNGGGIYTLQITPSPRLNLTPLSTNLMLSWIVPSTNFVLQQTPDLASWSEVTNPPILNLTNLQDEVLISHFNSSSFFRLISQ